MKNLKKLASVAMTGVLAMGVVPTVAFAQIDSSKHFTQTLETDATNTTMTNVTMSYTATAKGNAPANAVSMDNVTFNISDLTSTSGDKKTGSKNVPIKIDMDKFSKAGEYQYDVTATTTDGKTTFTDGNHKVLHLIVGYATDSNDIPTGNLKVLQAILKTDAGTKDNGFTAEKEREKSTSDLKLTKVVKGNLADKTKHFAFEIVFTGTPGKKYDISYAEAQQLFEGQDLADLQAEEVLTSQDATYATENGLFGQPLRLTISANGTGKVNVYLTHNQSVTIAGVDEDVQYVIREVDNDDSPESDYNTTWSIEGCETAGGDRSQGSDDNETGTVTIGRTNDHVTFVNSKNATVETGVMTTVVPFAAIMTIAALGYVAVKASKRRED